MELGRSFHRQNMYLWSYEVKFIAVVSPAGCGERNAPRCGRAMGGRMRRDAEQRADDGASFATRFETAEPSKWVGLTRLG